MYALLACAAALKLSPSPWPPSSFSLPAFSLSAAKIAASAPLAFLAGFTVRLTALYRGWEEPLAAEPAGVYRHDDGRPLLGRKIAGRSTRELRLLGLTAESHQEPGTPSAGPTRGGHHDQP